MHRIIALLVAVLLTPAALASRDGAIGIGDASIDMGQGCHDVSNCHPEEYAWVRVEACTASSGSVLLEVERVLHDAPPILTEIPAVVTGDLACPYRAAAFVELWTALVDMPVDCLRASLVADGVLATRTACFSDL